MTPKLLQAQMKTLAFLALEPARVQDAITPSAPRGLRLAGCGAATFRPPQSCEPMSYNIIYIHTQYIYYTHTRVHTRTRTLHLCPPRQCCLSAEPWLTETRYHPALLARVTRMTGLQAASTAVVRVARHGVV